MERPSFKRNGPNPDELELIGIEFALRDSQGKEHELLMTPCSIIIPRSYGGYYEPRITFHSSDGDYTMIGGRGIGRPFW